MSRRNVPIQTHRDGQSSGRAAAAAMNLALSTSWEAFSGRHHRGGGRREGCCCSSTERERLRLRGPEGEGVGERQREREKGGGRGTKTARSYTRGGGLLERQSLGHLCSFAVCAVVALGPSRLSGGVRRLLGINNDHTTASWRAGSVLDTRVRIRLRGLD